MPPALFQQPDLAVQHRKLALVVLPRLFYPLVKPFDLFVCGAHSAIAPSPAAPHAEAPPMLPAPAELNRSSWARLPVLGAIRDPIG
jgi:hypothetical protein